MFAHLSSWLRNTSFCLFGAWGSRSGSKRHPTSTPRNGGAAAAKSENSSRLHLDVRLLRPAADDSPWMPGCRAGSRPGGSFCRPSGP
uniref:Uncharacterized protein n=1 Tax=Ixodes ricinus TaxID=34613 RepID=A0A6B0UFN5_IXORI